MERTLLHAPLGTGFAMAPDDAGAAPTNGKGAHESLLYGELSRGQAWLIVPMVWAMMLLWSKPWLDRYRYGPFEWAWRSLSRWKWEPMRRPVPEPAVA